MDSLFLISQKQLEFPQVKEIIASFTHWQPGRNAVYDFSPKSSIDDIYDLQNKTRQLMEINATGENLPLGGLENISEIIRRAEKGSLLEREEFITVRTHLEIIAILRKTLLKWLSMPYIYETAQGLNPLSELARAIEKVFDKSGIMKDCASEELIYIRENIRETQSAINARLSAILRDPSRQKMFQEELYTFREGRYVIPVKQEYKAFFNGLVQDISTSGATLFMEPMEIVELNSQLRQFKAEEKVEIERIFRNLSAHIGRNKRELSTNQQVLAEFDSIYALSLYADKNHCTLPIINKTGEMTIRQARHPLLAEKAIPLDLELGKKYNILVVTGPNTGGKTVALKTSGLISLMALCGMPVPAAEGTEIPLFKGVFADIGDEQSIAQNLSTFSSHMNKIISILKEADKDSLVLLDELGAGTDPREGSAIGIALLEYLASSGAKTIITTHYGELKYFASNHPLSCNAAMEFNEETLEPSYKIIAGLPGRSCALAIAGRLGLPEALAKRAQELLTHEYIEMDKLLANIENKEKDLNKELNLHKKLRREANLLKEKYEEDMSFIKAEQMELFAEGAAEVESMVSSARGEIHRILKTFSRKLAASGKEQNIQKLSAQTTAKLDEILKRLEGFKKKHKLPSRDEVKIKPGDLVFLPSLNKNATVLEIKNDDLFVQVNRIKMRINLWNVRPPIKVEEQSTATLNDVTVKKAASVSSLNLIGMYVDEALYMLEKYIEEVRMDENLTFHIVHGKGTGTLRNAVHQFLRRSPLVDSFRTGISGEGSEGVTVVTLKE